MSDDPRNPADGKHVVVQNGQRVTTTMSEAEARAEAARRNQLTEAQGGQVPEAKKAKVVQNLCG